MPESNSHKFRNLLCTVCLVGMVAVIGLAVTIDLFGTLICGVAGRGFGRGEDKMVDWFLDHRAALRNAYAWMAWVVAGTSALVALMEFRGLFGVKGLTEAQLRAGLCCVAALVCLFSISLGSPWRELHIEDAFAKRGEMLSNWAGHLYVNRYRHVPLLMSLGIVFWAALAGALGRVLRGGGPEPEACPAWPEFKAALSPLIAAAFASPLLATMAEAVFVLRKPLFSDGAEVGLFLIVGLSFSLLVGFGLAVALALFSWIFISIQRGLARGSAHRAELLSFLSAVVVVLGFLFAVLAAGYNQAKVEVVRLQLLPSFAGLVGVAMLLLIFPAKGMLAGAAQRLRKAKSLPSEAHRQLWAALNVPLLVVTWPLWWVSERLLRFKARTVVVLQHAGLILIDLAAVGYCTYLIVYRFNHAGRFLHVIIARVMIGILAVCIFNVLCVAVRAEDSEPSRWLWVGAVALGLMSLATSLAVLQRNQNVAYVCLDRTEVLRSEIRWAREAADFDRDGYAALFDGGDPNDFDARISPALGYFVGEMAPPRTHPAPPPPVDWPRPRKANLVLLTIDALRADALGCYGYRRPTSPRIDAFAKGAVVFDRFLTQGGATVTSIRTLTTSHYSSRYMFKPLAKENLVSYLGEAGFNRFIMSDRHGIGAFALAANVPYTRLVRPTDDDSAETKTHRAIEHLKTLRPGDRFFLWVHYFDVHFDYYFHPGFPDFGRTQRDLYDNEITYTDHWLGVLLDFLHEIRKFDNSVIIISADHGSEFWEHGKIFYGTSLYNEVMHVPFIIRVPGIQPRRVGDMAASIDFLPTILDLFGVKPHEQLEGESLLPLMLGQPRRAKPVYFLVTGWDDKFALITEERWKFIYNREDNVCELYDLAKDPREYTNLVEREEKRVRAMRAQMFRHLHDGTGTYADPHMFKEVRVEKGR